MKGLVVVALVLAALGFAGVAQAEPRAKPTPAERELYRVINDTNACRATLQIHPLHATHRRWRGDRYDHYRLQRWRDRRDDCREFRERLTNPVVAIRFVFGPYASQALAVSHCESGWRTTAQNGQYLGMFQMGDFARGKYGHSWTPLGQARAAYAYFMDSGHDWSPWSCKPWS